MYLNNAISRINEIEWSKLGAQMNNDEKYLGYEYLRRMANFIKKQSLNPTNPLFVSVAAVLGVVERINYIEYCSVEVQNAMKNKSVPEYTVNAYLQLAKYVDENENAKIYLQIYEPLIRLLEQGLHYGYREGGLMIYNVAFYPLTGWYERFLNAPSKDI